MRKLLRRVGVEVTRHPAPNTLPWQIAQVLAHRRIDRVIDVGAHTGEFVRMLRTEAGYSGPVTSFEPSKVSYDVLVLDRERDEKWQGHNLALGDEAGTLTLNVFEGSDFNSFRAPNELGQRRFRSLYQSGTESVEVRRLDQVLDGRESMLVKVDTQGYDLAVLRGAEGVLRHIEAVVTELPVRPIYDEAPTLVEMLEQLGSWGFEPVGVTPLSRDCDGLRVIEFDGVFVRAR